VRNGDGAGDGSGYGDRLARLSLAAVWERAGTGLGIGAGTILDEESGCLRVYDVDVGAVDGVAG
jgi:hypothetical protein